MSIVRMGISPRQKDITRSQAQRHWKGTHAALFAEVSDLVSYVQNYLVIDSAGQLIRGSAGFDIFSEVEFADEARMSASVGSDYYQNSVLTDEAKLLDATGRSFLMTERVSVIGQPTENAYKVIHFIGKSEMGGHSDFERDNNNACIIHYKINTISGPAFGGASRIFQYLFRDLESAMICFDGIEKRYATTHPSGRVYLVRENVVKPREIDLY